MNGGGGHERKSIVARSCAGDDLGPCAHGALGVARRRRRRRALDHAAPSVPRRGVPQALRACARAPTSGHAFDAPGDDLVAQRGTSYGADVLLRQLDGGPVSGWLAYTYTVSTRVSAAGVRFSPGQDRRHNLLFRQSDAHDPIAFTARSLHERRWPG